MDFRHFNAGRDDDGKRLDKIARRLLGTESLSPLYKAIRKGLIKVNGKKSREDSRIKEGDVISVAAVILAQESAQQKKPRAETDFPHLDEVFRNGHLLVINKPYDMPVQPARGGAKSLSEIVEAERLSSEKAGTSLSFRTGPLHRLDRKTTGLLAFSQDAEGARIFSEMMREHRLEKRYIGIVLGSMESAAKWTDRIERGSGAEAGGTAFATVTVLGAETDGGKESITTAEPIARGTMCGKEATLVSFTIETGRTHQIRAQSAANGFPLLGDEAYGGGKIKSSRDFFLHALEIVFHDEEKKKALGLPDALFAPPAPDLADALKLFGCVIDGGTIRAGAKT